MGDADYLLMALAKCGVCGGAMNGNVKGSEKESDGVTNVAMQSMVNGGESIQSVSPTADEAEATETDGLKAVKPKMETETETDKQNEQDDAAAEDVEQTEKQSEQYEE